MPSLFTSAASVIRRIPMGDRIVQILSGGGSVPAALASAEGRPFSAGTPPEALLVEGTEPRAWVPPFAHNLIQRPRRQPGKELTAFDQLQRLADFDLVRIAIEDVKGQILGMEWEVAVKKAYRDQSEAFKPQVDAVRAWVEQPDPLAQLDWPAWLTGVLEEILVTDALALYPRRTRGGDPIGLEQIDGTTIFPVIDDRGRPMLPPEPAYLQIVHGLPETEFHLGELYYLPRNRRPDSPYGRSPVEQVILTINLALRNQLWDLDYFTLGNIPEAIYMLPPSFTNEQIIDMQTWVDNMLEGRSERRSGRMVMLPEGKYQPIKDRTWQYDFMEWLARVIAWSFGVSPLPIAKMDNRATAEVSEWSSLESGVRPVAGFVARVMNRYIRDVLGINEVEFRWHEDETADEATLYQRNVAYVHAGIATIDEIREPLGMQPTNIPAFVMTAAGPMFLEDLVAERTARQGQEPRQGEPPQQPPEPEEPAEPEEEPEKTVWDDAFGRARTRMYDDLLKWRRAALKRAREGRPQRPFRSSAIPPGVRRRIEEAIG